MAVPRCPKCETLVFETNQQTIANKNITFVNCVSCGTAVGVMEDYSEEFEKLKSEISYLESKIDR